MSHYVHTLTEIEIACGVTLEEVARVLPQVYLIKDTGKVVLPRFTPPALAGSVARCAMKVPCEFIGLNTLGLPVYAVSSADNHHVAHPLAK